MQVGEIINIIESVAPLAQQEGWDNSGLQIGVREAEVNRVLLCTDISEKVVSEAAAKHCQMIISHHPLLFHGLKTIQALTPQQRIVVEAIKHNIAIYSSHTAMDCYLHGVSGRMAKKLGIQNYKILSPTINDEIGLGVIGCLAQPTPFTAFLHKVKQTFNVHTIKYVESAAKPFVYKVAMCGGAGSEFVDAAIKQGADAYISADFKYHEYEKADGKISVLDIGHFESEQFTKEVFAELLNDKVECLMAEADCNPIKFY